MTNKVEIISHAFINLGEKPILDLETGNPIKAAALTIYESLYPSLLCLRPWTFALTTQQLNQLTEAPAIDDWKYAYQLPTDPKYLIAHLVRPAQNFTRVGDVLYSNNQSLKLMYTAQVDESKLDPAFVIFLEDALTARIAMTLTQQPTLQQLWNQKAEVSYSIASRIDSQSQPNQEFSDQPLFSAHFV